MTNSDAATLSRDDALDLLAEGEIELVGRLPWSSNGTFMTTVRQGEIEANAIYKPEKGERPLWDFPSGLYRREIAAFELADQLGWDMVPATISRRGPHGTGSIQLFVDADFEQHHFTLVEEPRWHPQLKRMCLFDLIVNNTDRKSGHCLLGSNDTIYGIDHGLCFAEAFKLRTVIWEFADEPIPSDLLADIAVLVDDPLDRLRCLLDGDEIAALRDRVCWLLESPRFPTDDSGRRYPWPLV